MAAWFSLLPFIPDVLKLASPLFTRSKPQDKVPDVLSTQVVELQNAAIQNTEAIRTLAAEMQKTIEAMQLGADTLAKDLRAARNLSIVAITAALLAFALAAYSLAIGT